MCLGAGVRGIGRDDVGGKGHFKVNVIPFSIFGIGFWRCDCNFSCSRNKKINRYQKAVKL